MTELADAFSTALALMVGMDREFLAIVGLSLRVSSTTVVLDSPVA
jgi:ABC-type tungstate transport system substrate-binding protein